MCSCSYRPMHTLCTAYTLYVQCIYHLIDIAYTKCADTNRSEHEMHWFLFFTYISIARSIVIIIIGGAFEVSVSISFNLYCFITDNFVSNVDRSLLSFCSTRHFKSNNNNNNTDGRTSCYIHWIDDDCLLWLKCNFEWHVNCKTCSIFTLFSFTYSRALSLSLILNTYAHHNNESENYFTRVIIFLFLLLFVVVGHACRQAGIARSIHTYKACHDRRDKKNELILVSCCDRWLFFVLMFILCGLTAAIHRRIDCIQTNSFCICER